MRGEQWYIQMCIAHFPFSWCALLFFVFILANDVYCEILYAEQQLKQQLLAAFIMYEWDLKCSAVFACL